ncbi:MAG: (4Fe-4S)-binding protein [Actinobacteria bacterium]|nr:(4Fe-4S)-binding protein [Actinomycetota bacterium]
MSVEHVSLRYFSGTGNTYRVACWIAEAARSRGVEVDMASISGRVGEPRTPTTASDRRLLGVLTPTHGFTATWASIVHAATTPGVRGAEVFTVATRAGWFVGSARLPGLEGTAAWLLALVLVMRGGHLVGVRAIDMPSNWTALHWGLSASHVAEIEEAAAVRAKTFAQSILEGRRQLTGGLSLTAGLLLAPVSLLYLALARPLLGKLFVADERCTSCALCAKHCPFGAVHMIGGPRKRPYWTSSCESCMRCMNVCPERAIQANWPLAAAQTWVMLAIYAAVTGAESATVELTTQVLAFIAACVAVLCMTGPVYWVAWRLSRLGAVAWLLGHMTPTRLFRRYREPETNLRDI